MDSVFTRGIEIETNGDGDNPAVVLTIPRTEFERLPLRVLVLEQDPLLRWAIVETLRSANHAVIEAWDVATAERARVNRGRVANAVSDCRRARR